MTRIYRFTFVIQFKIINHLYSKGRAIIFHKMRMLLQLIRLVDPRYKKRRHKIIPVTIQDFFLV